MAMVARVVRPDDIESTTSPQAQALQPMVTRATTGSTGISGAVVRMPAAGVSNVHAHAHSEIVIFVLSGRAVTLIWNEGTPQPLPHGPGDMCFVPAGVPHCAVNLDEDSPVLGVEFRTDPDFDDVVVLPDLQDQAEALVPELRVRYGGDGSATGAPLDALAAALVPAAATPSTIAR